LEYFPTFSQRTITPLFLVKPIYGAIHNANLLDIRLEAFQT
jgi:hypothetical protein